MKLLIKNMNNICSKILVRYELEKLGLHIVSIEFGEVELEEDLSTDILLKIDNTLNILGLELIQSDNKNHTIVKEIKNLVKESLKNGNFESQDLNFCELISKTLNRNYSYLSTIFTKINGSSIEHFIIKTKIDCVKKMLVNDEYKLHNIATKLKYCSVQHLSKQFKEITGKTPSAFRQALQREN